MQMHALAFGQHEQTGEPGSCVSHLAVLANALECICGPERQSATQGQERGVHRLLACTQNSNISDADLIAVSMRSKGAAHCTQT